MDPSTSIRLITPLPFRSDCLSDPLEGPTYQSRPVVKEPQKTRGTPYPVSAGALPGSSAPLVKWQSHRPPSLCWDHPTLPFSRVSTPEPKFFWHRFRLPFSRRSRCVRQAPQHEREGNQKRAGLSTPETKKIRGGCRTAGSTRRHLHTPRSSKPLYHHLKRRPASHTRLTNRLGRPINTHHGARHEPPAITCRHHPR